MILKIATKKYTSSSGETVYREWAYWTALATFTGLIDSRILQFASDNVVFYGEEFSTIAALDISCRASLIVKMFVDILYFILMSRKDSLKEQGK